MSAELAALISSHGLLMVLVAMAFFARPVRGKPLDHLQRLAGYTVLGAVDLSQSSESTDRAQCRRMDFDLRRR